MWFWQGLASSLGEDNGTPLQYSCLENPMDGGACRAAVHGVAEGRTRLSDFTFTFHFHALEKEMATHSSILAWRISGTGEPGGLPSMGSHRVGHDWNDLAASALIVYSCLGVFVNREWISNCFSPGGHWRWVGGHLPSASVPPVALRFGCWRLTGKVVLG